MKSRTSALNLEQYLGSASSHLATAIRNSSLNLGDCATHGDRPLSQLEREIGRDRIDLAILEAETALRMLRAAHRIVKFQPKSIITDAPKSAGFNRPFAA